MSQYAHTSFSAPAAIAAPALPRGAESAGRAHMLASGERKVAQQILAQVSTLCEQESERYDGEHRPGRSFWSFLRSVRVAEAPAARHAIR